MSEPVLADACVMLPNAAGMDRLHGLLDRFWSSLAELRAARPDRERIDAFTLALGEVIANIARHAYRETAPEDRLIELRLSATATSVRAELADAGLPFEGSLDETGTRDSEDPAALLEGGRGLGLIRQAVDAVSYERTADGRNRWVLVQRLG